MLKLTRIITAGAVFTLIGALDGPHAYADEQVAVITRIEGDAQIFTNPVVGTKPNEAEGPHALLDGTYYRVRPVKRGDRLHNGNVIQSGTNGKARLIYKNGDQITVPPGSAYRISWDAAGKGNPTIDLLFGTVRAVIRTGGPRADLEVKTKTAVMGVRGTDFHISAWSKNGGSEVTVLRGKVAVAKKDAPKEAKPVEVEAGYSATVVAAAPAPKSGKDEAKAAAPQPVGIKVAKASQQDFVVIQHTTRVVRAAPPQAAAAPVPEDEDLEKLEAEAVASTLVDIKATDPALFEQISKGGALPQDADLVQSAVVKKMFEAAPAPAGPRKPSLKDLDVDGDAYDKYRWGD